MRRLPSPRPRRGLLSTDRAGSPTGYDFTLDNNIAPLINPRPAPPPRSRRRSLTLPEGMTVNPSVAAGLGTCSEAQFAAETINS